MMITLPGKNCGNCGYSTCSDFYSAVLEHKEDISACIYLPKETIIEKKIEYVDNLDREIDFILDKFEDAEGPQETIHLFNSNRIKELDLKINEIIVGKPLGAGCPVTHCGKIKNIDYLSNVIDWEIIGPLQIRNMELKDIGCYVPVGFDGIVKDTKVELQIGKRYWWMPRHCMIQWRHSGIINYIEKYKENYKIRIEGVFLG